MFAMDRAHASYTLISFWFVCNYERYKFAHTDSIALIRVIHLSMFYALTINLNVLTLVVEIH